MRDHTAVLAAQAERDHRRVILHGPHIQPAIAVVPCHDGDHMVRLDEHGRLHFDECHLPVKMLAPLTELALHDYRGCDGFLRAWRAAGKSAKAEAFVLSCDRRGFEAALRQRAANHHARRGRRDSRTDLLAALSPHARRNRQIARALRGVLTRCGFDNTRVSIVSAAGGVVFYKQPQSDPAEWIVAIEPSWFRLYRAGQAVVYDTLGGSYAVLGERGRWRRHDPATLCRHEKGPLRGVVVAREPGHTAEAVVDGDKVLRWL